MKYFLSIKLPSYRRQLMALLCTALLLGASITHADAKPEAFTPTGDISASPSQLGNGYGHLVYYAPESADSELTYQLMVEVLDGDGEAASTIVGPTQLIPEFHFQFSSLSNYRAWIIAFDSGGEAVMVSPTVDIAAGQFIDVGRSIFDNPEAPEPTIFALEGDLEATLEIDGSNFPFVRALTEVTQDGVPFDGDPANFPLLELDAFKFDEDGRRQNLLDNLIPPQTGAATRLADIVIIHDDSGSLDDEAAQVRSNIISFLSGLSNSGIDFRIGLLPYGGGGGLSGSNGTILNGGILYDNGAGFISDLDRLRFDGGTERAWNAVSTAISGISYRSGSQKVFILIGDESVQSTISDSAIINQIRGAGGILFTLTGSADRSRYAFVSSETGGSNFDIRAPFNSILEEIGASIAAKYILTYETDNPAFDGQERVVDLMVTAPDPEGGPPLETMVQATYTPSPSILITPTPETNLLQSQGNRQQAALPISVRVDGGLQNNLNATLFYRNSDTGAFSSVAMGQTTQNTSEGFTIFTGSIPSNIVSPPSVFYYIQISDGQQTASLPSSDPTTDPIRIAILPNVAPVIQHTNVSAGITNQDITIPFSVEDNTNRVETATVFYRRVGVGGFQSQNFTVGNPAASLVATIPGAIVTGAGIEYYIEATDDFGVTSSFGTSDSPIQVPITASTPPSGSMDVNNLRVFADNFTDNGDGTTTASGNVQIAKIGGSPVMGFSGSLVINQASGAITSLGNQLIIALNIKLTGSSTPQNYQLFRGAFSIDSIAVSPSVALGSGESLLRLVGNLTFLYPNVGGSITIDTDKVVVADTIANITAGFTAIFNVGAIELAQNGQSTSTVQLTTQPGLEIPMKNPRWKFTSISLVMDFIQGTVTGTSGFKIQNYPRPGRDFSFSVTLGIRISPLGINTLGVSFSIPNFLPPFPPPPSAVNVEFESGSVLVDNIVTAKPLSLTVGGGAKITNSVVLDPFEDATGIKLLSGGVSVYFDTSYKVVLSGKLSLLEIFDLATARVQFGNPTELEATINLLQTLVGRLKLSAGIGGGFFEMSGQQKLTLQIPPRAPYIGGTRIADSDVQNQIRISRNGVQKAEFSARYALFFFDVGIRLDLATQSLFITGGGTTVQVFSDESDSPEIRALAASSSISVPAGQEFIVIRVVGDTSVAPVFTLDTPSGGTIDSTGIEVDPEDPASNPNITDVFFVSNAVAGEAYYALQAPEGGDYTVNISNDAQLGNFQVELVTPNEEPTLEFTAPLTDVVVTDATPVDITFDATDPDDVANIDLYLDNDMEGADGILIAADLVEGTDASFAWTPDLDTLNSGTYYIYARIDDGVNTPVVVRNATPIVIQNPQAPGTPENVQVVAGDGSLEVSWDAVAAPDLLAYRVLLSRTPGDGEFEVTLSGDTNTSLNIPDLANGVTYEIGVIAVNETTLESAMGGPVTATPTGTAVGSVGDLTFDLSSVSLTENGSEGVLTVDVINEGEEAVFSYRVGVYFGGMLESNLTVDSQFGILDPGETQSVMLTFDSRSVGADNSNVFVRIEDVILPELDEFDNTMFITSTLPFGPPPGSTRFLLETNAGQLDTNGNLRLNRQTGTFEHHVTLTNMTGGDTGPLRFTFTGLPADYQLMNATGNDDVTGDPYIVFPNGLETGGSTTLVFEYFSPTRSTAVPDGIAIDVSLNDTDELPVGTPASSVQLVVLPKEPGVVLLQVSGTPGVVYGLEYSDDGMQTWLTAPIQVTAPASGYVQFEDRGPPLTGSAPGTTPRFYRVTIIGN